MASPREKGKGDKGTRRQGGENLPNAQCPLALSEAEGMPHAQSPMRHYLLACSVSLVNTSFDRSTKDFIPSASKPFWVIRAKS